MTTDGKLSAERRDQLEREAGHHIAMMVLQVMKRSFSYQPKRYSAEAWENFYQASKIMSEELSGEDLSHCFEAAAKMLTLEYAGGDPWPKVAAAGAESHLANISSTGYAFGHRKDREGELIAAAKEAVLQLGT